ncbi:phosphatase PAP2 family protein [Tropicibacter sp. R15_0]|nr:phosphatase PAP2 family protein [Tropicibacter sp. R15_0]
MQNLKRLSREVRAAIFSFALNSKVEMTVSVEETATATLWRRDGFDAVQAGERPKFKYRELVEMTCPRQELFEKQLGFLTGYADIRQDRGAEILSQIGAPVPFYQTISFIDPARTPYTLELLATALRFTNYCEQQMKYALAVKRPIELSPQVQPMIQTPTHGSLPSGHATEAFMMARLIWKLMLHSGAPQYEAGGHWGEMLMRLAARIATNRTVAGVHYPVDSSAGAVLGLTLAEFVYGQCTAGSWSSSKFNGLNYSASSDLDWHALYVAADDQQKQVSEGPDGVWAKSKMHEDDRGGSDVLAWLWDKAQEEWADFDPCIR